MKPLSGTFAPFTAMLARGLAQASAKWKKAITEREITLD
jgi:hypothetical protein